MTTKGHDVTPYVRSGLEDDRNKPPVTNRQRVDEAASTILAFLPQLPEHKNEDTKPEQEATSNRLLRLRKLLDEHFTV